MSKIIIRGFRRQLKLGIPQQLIHEAVQSQEHTIRIHIFPN
jgi:hypothetical protein